MQNRILILSLVLVSQLSLAAHGPKSQSPKITGFPAFVNIKVNRTEYPHVPRELLISQESVLSEFFSDTSPTRLKKDDPQCFEKGFYKIFSSDGERFSYILDHLRGFPIRVESQELRFTLFQEASIFRLMKMASSVALDYFKNATPSELENLPNEIWAAIPLIELKIVKRPVGRIVKIESEFLLNDEDKIIGNANPLSPLDELGDSDLRVVSHLENHIERRNGNIVVAYSEFGPMPYNIINNMKIGVGYQMSYKDDIQGDLEDTFEALKHIAGYYMCSKEAEHERYGVFHILTGNRSKELTESFRSLKECVEHLERVYN